MRTDSSHGPLMEPPVMFGSQPCDGHECTCTQMCTLSVRPLITLPSWVQRGLWLRRALPGSCFGASGASRRQRGQPAVCRAQGHVKLEPLELYLVTIVLRSLI